MIVGLKGTSLGEIAERVPIYRAERVLASVAPDGDNPYLAFPAVLDLGDEVLVSFKRGGFHGGGAEAGLDLLRLDKRTDGVAWEPNLAYKPGKTMQMGEWMRYPDGTITNWIDAQRPPGTERDGMQGVISRDGGRTFGPLERFPTVDGMEFGYPFGSVVEGKTIWMIVMSFSHLEGGYSVIEKYPHAGPVCIIRSDDNGKNWSLVRNLTREFGDIPINESYFVREGDGFLVVTRGYDQKVRLHRTDNVFKVQRQSSLTDQHEFIERYVGRPRLFTKEGRFYLIGRNWTGSTAAADDANADRQPRFPKAMKMCLFRVNPETLAVESYAILNNAEAANVTDAYYPAPYWLERDGETFLRVVDYKGVGRRPPEIVEFEFKWTEVR
ncbi:MAG: hypothetical protein SynsKO_43460 [Synoicihabitans sp.]